MAARMLLSRCADPEHVKNHTVEFAEHQPRQLGDVRRDPKRCDAAIMSAIGGKADVRNLRLKRRS
jgi:hypothetical protein